MKDNLDISLGVLAWVIAIASFLEMKYAFFEDEVTMALVTGILPWAWVMCVAIAHILKKRPAKKLWWVWLSAPLALFGWLIWFPLLLFGWDA